MRFVFGETFLALALVIFHLAGFLFLMSFQVEFHSFMDDLGRILQAGYLSVIQPTVLKLCRETVMSVVQMTIQRSVIAPLDFIVFINNNNNTKIYNAHM